MADFLLELFSEEIPARMQLRAAEDLARLFSSGLEAAGMKAVRVETAVTPRRLALMAYDLPISQPDVREERRGPRTDAPAAAIDGFLKSTGLSRAQLEERDDPKGRFLYAILEKSGQPTRAVLAHLVADIVANFPWPKSQRWGAGSLRWVRPLQSIIALFDGEVVDVAVEGVPVGRVTQGHRFMHKGDIQIDGVADYEAKLLAAKVMLRHEKRQAHIAKAAQAAAEAAGLVLVEDQALLAEVAGLTEWPVPLLGRFDASFLDVPPEVIQLTAALNQKYFVCRDQAGKLANAFICTANIEAHDGGAAIVAGNQKVLAARLSDAKFFWEQDKRHKLDSYGEKLSQIIFHEKLGNMAARVARIAQLAADLAGVIQADKTKVARAAALAKCDLTTGMVGEFPELQGVMGRYYALAQGEDADVANAIADHYKPQGQGDAVPSAPVSVTLALAEKLDTLACFFAIGELPTGSKDPFALRRAALGVLAILVQQNLRVPLLPLLTAWSKNAGGIPQDKNWQHSLIDFFAERLKVQQREAGISHDLIDAIFALGGEDDLVRLLNRVKALQAFVGTEDGVNLLAGYKRAANILRIEEKKDGTRYDGEVVALNIEHPEESALRLALESVKAKAQAAVAAEDYAGAMRQLAQLRAPIDAFFNHVTVNDGDADVRRNRLHMLNHIRAAVHTVADFSKIEG